MSLILASASPRRAELLKQMGLVFRVVPSDLEEGEPTFPIAGWIQQLSKEKALAIPAKKGEIVLAADTVVILDEQVLGKPESEEAAIEMLKSLSGRIHQVMTGICVLYRPENKGMQEMQIYQDIAQTQVHFRKLSMREITAYIESDEPFDKAGSYGIQGLGALFVERIEGCYYNIVGLPLVKTMYLLRQCGVRVLEDQ
ncbi:MAG: septum formation inhibitor Maf [Firmicutes bacterium HGW-Firmicutes-12]|jgi:septum formation protein|nr:MAG: septum formation inhibitor Maf [Firmicutes bacterium HGW-Firmicutes-12]